VRHAVIVGIVIALSMTACSRDGSPAMMPPPPAPSPSDRATGQTPTIGSPASPASPAHAPPPSFVGMVSAIDDRTGAGMVSWHPGCPVGIADLRLVSLSYWGFDHRPHLGLMIVNRSVAWDVVRVFHVLFDERFPIRRMQPVDRYGGDDERSMAADNTSGFNCRVVAGGTSWSQHAYGLAIDLDPVENPEVKDGAVDPPSGDPYADRTRNVPGMIHPGDDVVRAFASIGWGWGGSWRSFQDWQHFSSNGR
jgi:hypothetical protein